MVKNNKSVVYMWKGTLGRLPTTDCLRWTGHVARMDEGTDAFKILTGKPTGKRSLRMPRGKWEDNIRMNLK